MSSSQTPKLLEILNHEEGQDLEFKRSVSGLDTEDLVAFANSKSGGVIYIGIDENKNTDGNQEPIILGCKTGDDQRLTILNKATSCRPAVTIEISKVFVGKKSIFKIEIPSGAYKPYCTQKGTYKIRDDARTKPIEPEKMLEIFIDREGDIFLNRFRQAASNISLLLHDIYEQANNLEKILKQISFSAQDAESNAEDALYVSEIVNNEVEEIKSFLEDSDIYELYSIQRKINALLEFHEIENPKITDLREAIFSTIRFEINQIGNTDKESILKKILNGFNVPINIDGSIINAETLIEWINLEITRNTYL